MPPLLLASSSPRRLQLLAQLGVAPDLVVSPDIDETPRPAEPPHDYALRMAREKAAAAIGRLPGGLVLAADTVVACGRRILPAATTPALARACLTLLSGRRHRVWCAVCLIDDAGRARERLVMSVVSFKRLSAAEIDGYVAGGEGLGKAGGYAIQGRAAGFVDFLSGSYTGVVGLPLYQTRQLLLAAGYHVD